MAGAAFLFAVPSVLPQAPQDNATLTGDVLDASGKGLSNAAVLIKAEPKGTTRNLKTDANGHFEATGLAAGDYKIEASAIGFTSVTRSQQVTAGSANELSITLAVAAISQELTVEGGPPSIASQMAPVRVSLDQESPHSIIPQATIENFDSPVADFTAIVQQAPGTFSVSPNGVGLGQSNTYFRGFADGLYTITWDGIPFEDTNSPTHHSWAFFPAPWIGGVDFDRSPGTASTVGPTNFGGSIGLLSRNPEESPDIRASVSYGSFDTRLLDLSGDSGTFMGGKSDLWFDVHQLLSNGYQTDNKQKRDGGALKYFFKPTRKTTVTAFVSDVDLWTNTPNFGGPSRAQVAQYGDSFLLTGNPTQPTFFGYNYYHVQTDFTYIGVNTDLGGGWRLDEKAYQYRYWNKQNYNSTTAINATSAVDKLNGYNKWGDTIAASQESKYGTFRVGVWYEWSYTDRYQYPTSPLTGIDSTLPNFHEHFITQSTQPYFEYTWRATRRLTLTAGMKYAEYAIHLNQYADNGKTVGALGGVQFVTHGGLYPSWLPSASGNYRITNNWSVYAQIAKGSVIPPSSVFDVKNALVETAPKVTTVLTYQAGSVFKWNRVSANVDAYHSHFQNAYSSVLNAATGEYDYFLNPDSITKGIEAEGNVYVGKGLSINGNFTAGSAKYVGSELWVQDSPRNTESIGFTYGFKNVDVGLFDKRIGQLYNDNGATHQAVSIAPFSVVNLYLNYTIKNASHLRDSKIRLSFNNLGNNRNIVGVTPAAATTSLPAPGDILTILPPRSIMVSFIAGWAPKR